MDSVVQPKDSLGFHIKIDTGQGQNGKVAKEIARISQEDCEDSCVERKECIGFDYSESESSCRLYAGQTMRTDPGAQNRKYCTFKSNK